MLDPVSQTHGSSCSMWPTVQVVECRRILKWTYTYGYYTFGEQADQPGSTTRIPAARLKQYLDFFEYNQVWPPSPSLCKPAVLCCGGSEKRLRSL